MTNRLIVLAIAVAILVAVGNTAAETGGSAYPALYFDYPLLGHRFYDFLDRCEAREDIPLQSHIRPYVQFHFDSLRFETPSDREARRFLSEGDARHFIAEGRMEKPFESGWHRLMGRLGTENRPALKWLYPTNHHFAAVEFEGKLALTYQPVYGLEGIWTRPEARGIRRSTAGFRLEGGFARAVHFMVDFRDHGESGRGPYTSRQQLYEDRWAYLGFKDKAKSISYDISESFVQYYSHNLSLAVGRGRHAWGPGRFGQLFLSAEGPPFDYARLDAVFRGKHDSALHYVFLHGFLKSVEASGDTLYYAADGRPRILDAQKFISAQRLEIRACRNLLLGFSQGVIYGDRDVELAYLTPISFFYSTQHAQGDKDNFLLSFDATWRLFRGLVTYGEFLVDDMAVSRIFTDDERNKSAYTLGVHAAPRGRLRFVDARIEYTRVRPFVYSHIFPVNVYTHYTSPLGYTLEPNSEFVTAEVRATLYPVQFGILWHRQNHGANSETPEYNNVGGSVYWPSPGLHGSYPFLDGVFGRTECYSLWGVVELLENFLVEARVSRISETNADARVETAIGISWNF
jgi:hypothetical protein